MSTSTSERRTADVTSWGLLHWVGVGLSACIATVNLYVGYVHSEDVFLVVGISFLVGVGLYFTRLWHPLFYLLGAVHVGALGVVWLLSGLQYFWPGVASGVLSVPLGVIALYLFLQGTYGPGGG